MKRNLILAAALAGIALPVAGLVQAGAQTASQPIAAPVSEVQLALNAPVSLTEASGIALKAVPGTLAEIGFNEEHGAGIYEASVVNKDSGVTLVKVDATSGKVLGTQQIDTIGNDHEHGAAQEAEDGDGDHGAGAGQAGDGDGESQDG